MDSFWLGGTDYFILPDGQLNPVLATSAESYEVFIQNLVPPLKRSNCMTGTNQGRKDCPGSEVLGYNPCFPSFVLS